MLVGCHDSGFRVCRSEGSDFFESMTSCCRELVTSRPPFDPSLQKEAQRKLWHTHRGSCAPHMSQHDSVRRMDRDRAETFNRDTCKVLC